MKYFRTSSQEKKGARVTAQTLGICKLVRKILCSLAELRTLTFVVMVFKLQRGMFIISAKVVICDCSRVPQRCSS